MFKLDTAGSETVLHSFAGADGAGPLAGLVRDTAGNLYGTTLFGGLYDFQVGNVFKLDMAGNETGRHSFIRADGAYPVAGLVRDAAGNLYGTTELGGTFEDGASPVFICKKSPRYFPI